MSSKNFLMRAVQEHLKGMKKHIFFHNWLIGVSLFLLAACQQTLTTPAATPTAESGGVFLPVVALAQVPTATPAPLRIGDSGNVPQELVQAMREIVEAQPHTFVFDSKAFDVRMAAGEGQPLVQWVYAVAAPFATAVDGVTQAEVLAAWRGEAGTMVLDVETAVSLTPLLGPPAETIPQVPPEELAATLWAMRPALTLLPFHRLTPDLKVLAVDGVSPLDDAFDAAAYPFVLNVGLAGNGTAVTTLLEAWNGPTTNRDPARLTTIALTGVTALVRGTAFQMEYSGVLYPGQEVAPILQAADIAHVSNEVAFTTDCPFPDPLGGTSFCSRESYFDLLLEIGVDVVEVTGNHVNDRGVANFAHTLDMYDAAGLAYFGGGRDAADAAKPALFTHNGNRIALVGCNWVGPNYAWATAVSAGSRPCDDTFFAQITQLNEEGYLVLATLQYQELYYYQPSSQQQADFARVAAAGAAAVSGSQGHHVQGFAFADGTFIHYGLGNLFFDQMDRLGTRQTLVDRYVVYNGRLLSVQLWSGLIENYARPREMTPAERQQLLQILFEASGW